MVRKTNKNKKQGRSHQGPLVSLLLSCMPAPPPLPSPLPRQWSGTWWPLLACKGWCCKAGGGAVLPMAASEESQQHYRQPCSTNSCRLDSACKSWCVYYIQLQGDGVSCPRTQKTQTEQASNHQNFGGWNSTLLRMPRMPRGYVQQLTTKV